MSSPPLKLSDVTFSAQGERLIDDISLEISEGARTLVLGPNGAGKSLLLRICHGLLTPDSGAVQWHGSKREEDRQRQAMVFQKPVMLRRSVRANVAYGLKIKHIPRRERDERVERYLARVGLSDIADRPAQVLSGGEQQKLALARAWALEPDVLFLDEPTANLDLNATQAVENIVREIHGGGTTIVMTTQDLRQARRLANEVIFMYRGKIAEHSPAGKFFDKPVSNDAQAFLDGELTW